MSSHLHVGIFVNTTLNTIEELKARRKRKRNEDDEDEDDEDEDDEIDEELAAQRRAAREDAAREARRLKIKSESKLDGA
ncbi:hypothetical protein A1O3_02720 [Capronia epimyces CBS 606.96]|uniref:Uncharacterized protein n=1 Tax=Capronia epimyces CBS 606.96 TaxID=1182542 RepID=W9YAU8_9EURO|nr:uncharacterized protein A1O3_02720 [Capronia epimyces CBS 606.96]EXJ89653.1 hypothetical protein A1O3_02720 [Capronia epimyces CBS 606.96]